MIKLFKTILIKIIKILLYLLDNEHRVKEEITISNTKKFTHVQKVDFNSDFAKASKVFRTVPYQCWELKTTNITTYAADKHLYIKEDGSQVWLEDLKPGDKLKSKNGIETVVSVKDLGFKCHMYDLQIESSDHLYYADGLLSHNTTVVCGYLLWYAMFRRDSTILIVANNGIQAMEIMSRIRFAYEECPDYIRAGVKTYNKGSIEFENGSRIISRATSPHAGRGLSITVLFVDEMAFIHPNIAEAFWTAIQPTLSTGGRIILTSTPNGDDDVFAQIWRGASDNIGPNGNLLPNGVGKNGYKSFMATWDRHPNRSTEWAENQRAQIGDDRFRREHECQFLVSDETLVDSLALRNLKANPTVDEYSNIRWYSKIEPNRTYVVTLDPAVGTGGERAAIQVYQLPELIQVAEWCDNKTPPKGQVEKLHKVLKHLTTVLQDMPENKMPPNDSVYWSFENNGIGEAITAVITETGLDRFPGYFMNEPKYHGRTHAGHRMGLSTSNKKKLTACMKLKSLIESSRIKINSAALISELKNYVRSGPGFDHRPGTTDDLVSATLLSIRLIDIVKDYDPALTEKLSEIIEMEGDRAEPMPFIMLGSF